METEARRRTQAITADFGYNIGRNADQVQSG
jgi:hypothetical protein